MTVVPTEKPFARGSGLSRDDFVLRRKAYPGRGGRGIRSARAKGRGNGWGDNIPTCFRDRKEMLY